MLYTDLYHGEDHREPGGDDGLFILPLFYLDLFLIPRCVNPIRMSSEGALEMNRCG